MEGILEIRQNRRTKKMDYLSFITLLTALLTYFTVSPVSGNPVQSVSSILAHTSDPLPSSNDHNLQSIKNVSECVTKVYDQSDVAFFDNGSLSIKGDNITILPESYQTKDGKISVCLPVRKKTKLDCKEKFEYESGEYHINPNNSVVIDDVLTPETSYEMVGDIVLICAPPEALLVHAGIDLQKVAIYVGQIGSGISIIALIIHLLTFLYLPSLRNLHGHNLASLSVAFMLAYSFVLIGQIPQVLGLSCVISGILQQNFFLSAFFCMNVLAFDIWLRLKQATKQLYFEPQNERQKKFVWYSLYAWGMPLVITSISVIVDNVKGIPKDIKPDYGKDDVCWMGHNLSKAIFFALPVFTLIVVNAIFFIMTAWILFSNKMECTKDQRKHADKTNFFLYVKLGIMMGLTWMVGIVAYISQNDIVWLIFDILNSLQGLFLLLLFTCTRKVATQIAEKTSAITISTGKKSSDATAVPTKNGTQQLERH